MKQLVYNDYYLMQVDVKKRLMTVFDRQHTGANKIYQVKSVHDTSIDEAAGFHFWRSSLLVPKVSSVQTRWQTSSDCHAALQMSWPFFKRYDW